MKYSEFKKDGEIYIHKYYDENLINESSLLVDGTIDLHNPRKMRWFSPWDISQMLRFMIALNWTKNYFLSLKEKRIMTIIDFGCSWSQFYAYWRYNCNYFGWPKISYHGVDGNKKRLIGGRKNIIPKRNDRFNHYLANLTKPIKMPYKGDVIVCLETIEHIEREKVPFLFDNIKRNLKNNGIVILSSPNLKRKEGEEWVWKNESCGSHKYEWSFEEIIPLVESNGFKVAKRCGITPRREYKSRSSYSDIIKNMASLFPTSIINSMFVTVEDMNLSKMWMMLLQKRSEK